MTAMILPSAKRSPSVSGLRATPMTLDGRARPTKFAGSAAEGRRPRQPVNSTEVRRHLEEALVQDLVDQEVLNRIAEHVWAVVPYEQRAKFGARDWQKAIFDRCARPLQRAEERLKENRSDDKLLAARIKMLRETFTLQVHHAMRTVAAKYNAK